MPFTVSHIAAALPFRKTRLVYSAVVAGTVAPDFEYFLRMAPQSEFGHRFPGILLFTLPLAVFVLWLFRSFMERPLIQLLPGRIAGRIAHDGEPFRLSGPRRFALTAASALVVILTHVVWDSFTHTDTWLYHHWSLLRYKVLIPGVTTTPVCKILQHVSTLVGLAILAVALWRWYRETRPTESRDEILSPLRKTIILATMSAVALAGAFNRALLLAGEPILDPLNKPFIIVGLVTAIGLLWWELLIYGIMWSAHSTPRA